MFLLIGDDVEKLKEIVLCHLHRFKALTKLSIRSQRCQKKIDFEMNRREYDRASMSNVRFECQQSLSKLDELKKSEDLTRFLEELQRKLGLSSFNAFWKENTVSYANEINKWQTYYTALWKLNLIL